MDKMDVSCFHYNNNNDDISTEILNASKKNKNKVKNMKMN